MKAFDDFIKKLGESAPEYTPELLEKIKESWDERIADAGGLFALNTEVSGLHAEVGMVFGSNFKLIEGTHGETRTRHVYALLIKQMFAGASEEIAKIQRYASPELLPKVFREVLANAHDQTLVSFEEIAFGALSRYLPSDEGVDDDNSFILVIDFVLVPDARYPEDYTDLNVRVQVAMVRADEDGENDGQPLPAWREFIATTQDPQGWHVPTVATEEDRIQYVLQRTVAEKEFFTLVNDATKVEAEARKKYYDLAFNKEEGIYEVSFCYPIGFRLTELVGNEALVAARKDLYKAVADSFIPNLREQLIQINKSNDEDGELRFEEEQELVKLGEKFQRACYEAEFGVWAKGVNNLVTWYLMHGDANHVEHAKAFNVLEAVLIVRDVDDVDSDIYIHEPPENDDDRYGDDFGVYSLDIH